MSDRVERRGGDDSWPGVAHRDQRQITLPSAERDLSDLGDDLCTRCGVNLTSGGGLCRFCSMDDDFENCEFCHGTDCTGECDEYEEFRG